jgi:uncharacterized membrane protein
LKYSNFEQRTIAVVFLLAMIAAGAEAQLGRRPLDISIDTYFREEIDYGGSVSFEGRVSNRSDRVFTGVQISARKPPGWSIEIEPEYIATIYPGEQITFTIDITPRRSIFLEKHRIPVTARSGTTSDVHTLTVVANPRIIWISAGLVLVALVGIGFGFVFWRLNRS